MLTHRTIAGVTTIAALAAATAGSAAASASQPAPGDAPLGSLIQDKPVKVVTPAPTPAPGDAPLGSLIQKKPVRVATPAPAAQPQPARCRAWRLQGQSWYAAQDNGFTLMFNIRMPRSSTSRFGGNARYYRSQYGDIVGSQYLSGAFGPDSRGVVRIHMNIVWSNGTRGQYNGTAYDARPTQYGGLTASLKGVAVDTTGNGGGAAHWWADGLEGPWGDTAFLRPLFCAPADVVR